MWSFLVDFLGAFLASRVCCDLFDVGPNVAAITMCAYRASFGQYPSNSMLWIWATQFSHERRLQL